MSDMFAFYFTTLAEDLGPANQRSDLTLGYYDRSKFSGKIKWHNIKMKYMFGVKLDDIKVNGKPLNICKAINGTCLITFDSGTTMSSVPKAAANVLVAQGVPTTNHVVECGGEEEIGSLTYVIGGKDYTLESHEWLFPK